MKLASVGKETKTHCMNIETWSKSIIFHASSSFYIGFIFVSRSTILSRKKEEYFCEVYNFSGFIRVDHFVFVSLHFFDFIQKLKSVQLQKSISYIYFDTQKKFVCWASSYEEKEATI